MPRHLGTLSLFLFAAVGVLLNSCTTSATTTVTFGVPEDQEDVKREITNLFPSFCTDYLDCYKSYPGAEEYSVKIAAKKNGIVYRRKLSSIAPRLMPFKIISERTLRIETRNIGDATLVSVSDDGYGDSRDELFRYIHSSELLFSALMDRFSGDSSFHYPDGAVYAKGSWHEGRRAGDWEWFDSNGDILMTAKFEDGVPCGDIRRRIGGATWIYKGESFEVSEAPTCDSALLAEHFHHFWLENGVYVGHWEKDGKQDSAQTPLQGKD